MPTPEFLPGEVLSAGKLQQLATSDTYTPTLQAETTNPVLGTAPGQVGYYWVTGQHVTLWAYVMFGTSPTAGSGRYFMTLPPAFPVLAGWPDFPIGECRLVDVSVPSEAMGTVIVDSVTRTRVWMSIQGSGTVTHASPIGWAAGDFILLKASYLTDPY